MSDYESRREDAKRDAYYERFGDPPSACSRCGSQELSGVPSYIYGDDADGRRGVRVPAAVECNACGEVAR